MFRCRIAEFTRLVLAAIPCSHRQSSPRFLFPTFVCSVTVQTLVRRRMCRPTCGTHADAADHRSAKYFCRADVVIRRFFPYTSDRSAAAS